MQYIVTRSFYEGNTLHQEGEPFVSEDQAYIQKCLADGNIADSNGGSEITVPLVEQPQDSASPETPQTETPAPEAPQSVQPVVAPQVSQLPEQPQLQPTQEEIEATIAASEASSENSVDIQ
jgi:hypothetical protein